MDNNASPPNALHPSSLNSSPVPLREAVFATVAGFLGWMLDSFDFFLVVIALPRIASDFHVKTPAIAASLTLTLVFRPVGALIFGLLADRYGRRIPMMIDLVFYSAVEVATAFAPNLTTFLILRALFGIGMGGEWGVGTSLVMEKVPAKWRGLLSGFLQEGYAAGYLLSAVAAYFMLDRFGWRPMFLLGGAPALLALFIRIGVRESEVWRASKAESWAQLLRDIGSHWKLWVYLTLLMAMMNLSSHGTQDMYPTFMQHFRGLDAKTLFENRDRHDDRRHPRRNCFRHVSDRFGRRSMMILAFIGALAVVPLWAFSSQIMLITTGRIPHAVHGARRVGHHPGTHKRAFSRSGPGLFARILLSVRKPHRRFDRLGSSDSRRKTFLPSGDGG